MWENSLEKLKILGYENEYCRKRGKKPLNRVHFVLPGANLSHQFDDFVEICSWLSSQITGKSDFFKPEEFDDPTTVVNKLMLALRQLEFRLSFPSQKLKSAHGEATCSVIEFLTDKALATRDFQWAVPIYSGNDEV